MVDDAAAVEGADAEEGADAVEDAAAVDRGGGELITCTNKGPGENA